MNGPYASRRPVAYGRPPQGYPGYPARPYRRRRGGMSTGKMIGIGVGVLAAIAVAYNIPDLVRYIRIARM